MSKCPSGKNSILNYLDDNKLISCLTTFTFVVIFIFIYILRVYTFFDNRRIPRAVRPFAPFGNIKDVLFQETNLYVYLWKYYNKFKRKKFEYGGLYLFFKPSLLIINPGLIQTINLEESISDAEKKSNANGFNVNIKLFNDESVEHFLIKYNIIKDGLLLDLGDKSISTVMHNFFMETTSTAFGFKTTLEFLSIVNSMLSKKTEAGFKYYFGLVYPFFQRNINLTPKMEEVIQDIINYRKKNDVREKDLLQNFIDSLNQEKYKLKEIVPEIFEVFVENIIYSYSSLMFSLYELAVNKEVQQNLIDEIRRFNKKEKTIHLRNLQEFSYLDAVVKETLRKYPPVPTIIKKCKENYKIDGVDLPKGMFIFYSIMGIHRDPTNYPQPEKFDPDRFLEEDKKFISNVYIPFGIDIRKDIGLRFTTLHIKLALINIFSMYKVTLKSNQPLEFDNTKLPLYPKQPLPITFEPLSKEE